MAIPSSSSGSGGNVLSDDEFANNNLVRVRPAVEAGLGLPSLGGACFGQRHVDHPDIRGYCGERSGLTFEANLGQFDTPTRFVAQGRILLSRADGIACSCKRKWRRLNGRGFFAGFAPERGPRFSRLRCRSNCSGQSRCSHDRQRVVATTPIISSATIRRNGAPGPSYARVRVTDVYPGIHLLHYGNQRQSI